MFLSCPFISWRVWSEVRCLSLSFAQASVEMSINFKRPFVAVVAVNVIIARHFTQLNINYNCNYQRTSLKAQRRWRRFCIDVGQFLAMCFWEMREPAAGFLLFDSCCFILHYKPLCCRCCYWRELFSQEPKSKYICINLYFFFFCFAVDLINAIGDL